MSSHHHEELRIRAATTADSDAIADIYNHYVSETGVTFEEAPVSPSAIAERIRVVVSASLPWLIAERAGRVVGYACASEWKNRPAYRFTAKKEGHYKVRVTRIASNGWTCTLPEGRKRGARPKYDWAAMEVGDSVYFDTRAPISSARKFQLFSLTGWKCSYRTEGKGVRIWRIA